jgi:hypothetical protein
MRAGVGVKEEDACGRRDLVGEEAARKRIGVRNRMPVSLRGGGGELGN